MVPGCYAEMTGTVVDAETWETRGHPIFPLSREKFKFGIIES
jgi:hypothetical protein